MNFPLWITAVVANIISLVLGVALTWTSPVLPKLSDNNLTDNPFGHVITSEENSWIGALMPLGAIFGPFIFGYAADMIGRKLTLLSLGFFFIFAYLLLAFAKVVWLYYLARLIIGAAVGGVYTVIPMYLGEIAEDSNRGAISTMMNLMLCFGAFLTYVIGPYISLLILNLLAAVVSGLFVILFFFLGPETPHYYVGKDQEDKARKVLDKLRGNNSSFVNRDEVNKLRINVERSRNGRFTDLFKTRGLMRALIITFSLATFQQLSGINAILFFAQTIFVDSGSSLDAEIPPIIVGAVLFTSGFITPISSDKLDRKPLLYISTIGSLLSEVLLGVYFFLRSRGNDVSRFSWLPVVCLVLYIIFYSFGLGPLPWTIMGEIFPPNIKSIASSFTVAFCWFISFFTTKFFQSMVDAIGMGQSFWIFAGFCLGAFFFTFFYVIETKGRSFQEIQEILES